MTNTARHPKSTVSLVVAISGHRDLYDEDLPLLQKSVHEILKTLHKTYPDTALLLLTGLAEGADRVAARAMKELGFPYIAVLPMKADLYRIDFQSPESSAEFESLLHGAASVLELPNAEGVTDHELNFPGAPKRNVQYHALGRFLTQYSQVLIAIWDGGAEIKQGGTYHVIRLKLGDLTEFEKKDDFATRRVGTGPVHVVYVRRKSSHAPRIPRLESPVLWPEGTNEESYSEAYRLLNRFNRDVAEGDEALCKSAEKSRNRLVAEHKVADLSPNMEWAARVYSFADALAGRYNSWSIFRWQIVYLLLAITGLLLVWVHFDEKLQWLPLAGYYIGFLAVAAFIGYEQIAKRRERHEDYRALAEALRVQFFWMVAGLSDFAADNYQTQQAGEMAWIRDAISECALYQPSAVWKPIHQWKPAQSYQLAHAWISGQKEYFAEKSLRYEKLHNRYNTVALIAGGIGILVPLAAFIAHHFHLTKMIAEHLKMDDTIVRDCHIVAAILLWWAALGWSYIERRGWAYLARQYARMYRVFSNSETDLLSFEKAGNFEFCRLTIFELGCEALAENAEWLVTHREHKLSLKMLVG
jgi:hypothetical protein